MNATEVSLDIGYMRRRFSAGRSETQGSRLPMTAFEKDCIILYVTRFTQGGKLLAKIPEIPLKYIVYFCHVSIVALFCDTYHYQWDY